MAQLVQLFITLILVGFIGCGVKGPPTAYLDVVAKEKAAEEAKLKKEKESLALQSTPTPTPVNGKKTDSKKKK